MIPPAESPALSIMFLVPLLTILCGVLLCLGTPTPVQVPDIACQVITSYGNSPLSSGLMLALITLVLTRVITAFTREGVSSPHGQPDDSMSSFDNAPW